MIEMNLTLKIVRLDMVPFLWIGNAQSSLINGGGIYTPCLENKGLTCAADCSVLNNWIKTITVDKNKTYRLRIVGAQELIGMNFKIKDHNMTVVEVDGTIVVPYTTDNLDIMPGQRYSVLVTFDKDVGNYWATTGVRYRDAGPKGYIRFKYDGAADTTMTFADIPTHPAWDDQGPTNTLNNNLKTKTPNSYADADVLTASNIRRIILVGNQLTDPSTKQLRWAMNNVTYKESSTPAITAVYDAVNAYGALPWPNTVLPGKIRLPDNP